MSWLNNSLNTIKGQLTTLAQEVLAETAGPGDDEYRGTPVSSSLDTRTVMELLAETQKDKEELDKLCTEKETEILMLRKQIEVLQHQQQQHISDAGGGSSSVGIGGGVGAGVSGAGTSSANSGRNSKSPTDNNGSSPLEDSWCWEPDNNAKQDNDHSSETSSGGGNSHDLVNIMLDDMGSNETAATKFGKVRTQRSIGAGGSGIQQQQQQQQQMTAEMQKRLLHLEEENKRLNVSLEELDAQHNLAMESVLELKSSLQEQLNVISKDYEIMERGYQEKCVKMESDMKYLRETIQVLTGIKEKAEEEKNLYEERFKGLEDELKQRQMELNDAQECLSKKVQDNHELIELIKERDQKILELLAKQEEYVQKEQDKKKSSDSSNSSLGKQSDEEFIVVRREIDGNSSGVTGEPPTKEELKDKIVELENKISSLTVENENLTMKMAKILEENEKSIEELNRKFFEFNLKDSENIEVASHKLTNINDIVAMIRQSDNELKLLKETNQLLNRDLEDLKETFNDENVYLTKENERLQAELMSLRKSQSHFNELEQKLQTVTVEMQQLKLNAEAEAEASLHHHAAMENKLKMLQEENILLKNDIERISRTEKLKSSCMDLSPGKRTITDLDDIDEDKNNDVDSLFNNLKVLIMRATKVDINVEDNEYAHQMYQILKEKFCKMFDLERSLTEMSEKLRDYQDNKFIWDHEKKTLEADISQYMLQCNELMKNNEILLNELENYKRHKLETISEHNEENVVQLEGQLEDINKLNNTLMKKIEELEMDNGKLLEKLREKQFENDEQHKKENDYNLQVEALELEKCKLLLQLKDLEARLENEYALRRNDEEKLEQFEKQLNCITKECHEQKQMLEECRHNKAAVDEELLAKDIITKSLNDQINVLHDEEHKLKHEIEQLHKEMERKNHEMQKLVESGDELIQLRNERDDTLKKLKHLEEELLNSKNELSKYQENAALAKDISATDVAKVEEEKKILMNEKQEMIKVLQQKHSENTQYYTEIQRLQMIVREMTEQQELKGQSVCDKCTILESTVDELNKEQVKLKDQIVFLKEKSDILTTNLLTEQTNQKLVREENADVQEQNATLRKDLERLRGHLLEVEDTHTQEIIEMEKQLEQMRQKMLTLEEEATQSSTAYTSASIRANQHAETLQAQHALVVQQRDELVVKLSLAEDRESKNQAAIVNLQCALEQFQNSKENDIKLATQRVQRELQKQYEKETELRNEIQQLEGKLAEANHGLEAATRLSDQLEASQQTVVVLREEANSLRERTKELESKLSSTEGSQADKIDKSLIKSLLIGYVVSSNMNDKQQILRMIASILEFTQSETDKIGLNKTPSSGWFGSLLGGTSSGTINGNNGIHSKENLIQAFVQFLEQESQPKSNKESEIPNLLHITGINDSKQTGDKSRQFQSTSPFTTTTTNSSNTSSASLSKQHTTSSPAPVPLLLNSNAIIQEFPMSRNSSSILKDILNDT